MYYVNIRNNYSIPLWHLELWRAGAKELLIETANCKSKREAKNKLKAWGITRRFEWTRVDTCQTIYFDHPPCSTTTHAK